MTRIVWDEVNARELTIGVDKVVIFPFGGAPVAWSGILSISEEPEDVETAVYYYDGQSYVKQKTAENFSATIQALTYPEALDQHEEFHLAYRVQAGNGYDIHLVYNATATPSQVDRPTIGDSAEAADFQWKMTAIPELVDQLRAVAHVIINTEDTVPVALAIVENMIYGTDSSDPRIPHLPELIDLYETNAVFKVVDHGDGSWTATGPDDWFVFPDGSSFEITSPSAVWLDSESYRLSNW